MTTPTRLAERLHDLADDAPHAFDTETESLWRQGRRDGRRRRAAVGAVVVMVALLAAFATGTALERTAPQPLPVAAGGEQGLPDHFYDPSPWLPDDEGAPGPLVAVMPAERGAWGGGVPAVVGVVASTQEYRFLELPDVPLDEDLALSPDGTQVAWWTTDGDPNGSVTGYAVYDTGTGEVRRREVESGSGIVAVRLLWADDETLVAQYGPISEVTSGADAADGVTENLVAETWTSAGEPVELPQSQSWLLESTNGNGDVVVVDTDRAVYLAVDVAAPATPVDLPPRASVRGSGTVVLSPDGRRFATQASARTRNAQHLRAAVQIGAPEGVLRDLPGSVFTRALVGWADDSTIVGVDAGENNDGLELVRYPVDGGDPEAVSDLARTLSWDGIRVAGDQLASPVVEAVEPPSPLDPRIVAAAAGGAGVLIVAGGAAAFLWWRRRRVAHA